MHLLTASSSRCDRDFVLHLMLCSKCSSKQIGTKYDINIRSKNKKTKNKLHLARSFILDSLFHEHVHTTFVIAQR